MRPRLLIALVLLLGGCRRALPPEAPPAAFGAAIVDATGEIPVGAAGATLEQPLAVQVNDADGNALPGARVQFSGPDGVQFEHPSGVTGDDGQFATKVRLASTAGRYSLIAITRDKTGKPFRATITAIALDYQQTLGRELSEKHCARCHDARSTAERVSNHDNLSVPPHAFTDGAALNRINQASLIAIITHGGPAIGKSPEMPPYSPTLSPNEISALAAYIRAVANPAFE